MAGNLATVTAAIARTASPTVFRPAGAGNPESTGGQTLPPQRTPQAAPRLDFSQVARQLNAFVESGQRSLRFRVDDATGRTVITVVDESTQRVVRQIPSEETLAVARHLDSLQGLLVDARV